MRSQKMKLRRGGRGGGGIRKPGADGSSGRAGRRRGRGPRALKHGDLRLLILDLIQAKPAHGYGLISQIETLSSGSYKPSPGVMYPALEVLQDMGWIKLELEAGKKVFYITDEGKTALSNDASLLTAVKSRLAGLARDEDAGPDDVRAAMGRMRHAIRQKVKDENASLEQREKIVEILNSAREEIAALG